MYRIGPIVGSLVLCWAVLAAPAAAQTSYLMITDTVPVAVQRGKSTEVTVEGAMNFAGVYKALIEGAGIRPEVVSPTVNAAKKSSGTVRLRLTVAPDASLGVREFRLASRLGISSIGQFVVVDAPVVMESGDNNTREKANPISIPCVVSGRIEAAEDVDYFRFHAEAGQTLTFEVLCARLQDKIHDLQKHADPLLSLYDASGRELASNDDFFFADPLLSYTVRDAGEYYLQIRDSRYEGNRSWVYAILATNRPYLSGIYPMAGNPGQTVHVEPIAFRKDPAAQIAVRVPAAPGVHQVQVDLPGGQSNPVTVIASSLPQILEREPNDTPEEAMPITIPCGINGRIGRRNDCDCYRFHGKKGRTARFEVEARRFGTALLSSLDSVLDILTPSGKLLASNDDTFGKDAALLFTPPADGDFIVRIRDLTGKGGERAVYYLEADWAAPDFSLRCDPDKAMIGPGSSTSWFVHVTRTNGFTGPVTIAVEGLPHGVSVSPLTIAPAMNQGLLALTASKDAPRDAVNVRVVGKATVREQGGDRSLVRVAVPNEEIYLPGGGRGRFNVGMQSVAVTDPSDILAVDVTPATLTLTPGQEQRIDVTVRRRPDYNKGVSLDVLMQHLGSVYGNPLPPGVTVVESKSKTLLGTGNSGYIVLKAAPTAPPIEDVPVSVLANVSINFVVKISYSSPPILLSVGEKGINTVESQRRSPSRSVRK
jgi:Bacterial pre-peptidase C-terminal domain